MLHINIDNKRFRGRTPDSDHLALQGVEFSVRQGEFACLIGPSGCGKSTLINIINGLDLDYAGNVSLNGAAPRQDIATMFQSPRLMPWLSVLDNVTLVLEDSAQALDKARNLLSEMELADVIHAYPNRLSGGMQRRVALARAFAIEPQLLLMDEPFVSLDAPVANRLRTMLIELWQQRGITVLFVTHDLREALALADRVIFLSKSPGRVVLQYEVELPRPRHPEQADIIALQNDILQQHPDLLAGLLDHDQQQS